MQTLPQIYETLRRPDFKAKLRMFDLQHVDQNVADECDNLTHAIDMYELYQFLPASSTFFCWVRLSLSAFYSKYAKSERMFESPRNARF